MTMIPRHPEIHCSAARTVPLEHGLTYEIEVRRYNWPDGTQEMLVLLDSEVLKLADVGDEAYGERLLAAAEGDAGA